MKFKSIFKPSSVKLFSVKSESDKVVLQDSHHETNSSDLICPPMIGGKNVFSNGTHCSG